MSLAGTVSWPEQHKRRKGYISEISTIKAQFKTDQDPVEFQSLYQTFKVAKIKQPTNSIDLGSQPLDRETTRIRVLKGEEWNTSIF